MSVALARRMRGERRIELRGKLALRRCHGSDDVGMLLRYTDPHTTFPVHVISRHPNYREGPNLLVWLAL